VYQGAHHPVPGVPKSHLVDGDRVGQTGQPLAGLGSQNIGKDVSTSG